MICIDLPRFTGHHLNAELHIGLGERGWYLESAEPLIIGHISGLKAEGEQAESIIDGLLRDSDKSIELEKMLIKLSKACEASPEIMEEVKKTLDKWS